MGINELRRQILLAAGKDLNPPLMVEHDTVVELDITPNGLMVTRPAVKMGPQYLKSDTNLSLIHLRSCRRLLTFSPSRSQHVYKKTC